MKKFDLFKTIQLLLFIVLAGLGIYIIFTDKELYRLIATDSHIRAICALLWAVLAVAFIFTFLDFTLFSTFKKDYRELNYAVSSDPVAGIANRYSCDTVIEKYLDKPLPEDVGCIMFDLSNIKDINRDYGHLIGNTLIYDFSNILHLSSMDIGFVGRNGGNKFLVLIENCSNEKLKTFLDRISKRVEEHNLSENSIPIRYEYGIAFHEDDSIGSITELIALSNNRIYMNEDESKEI